MCLPGDENRADDHFASSICVCRGKKVCVQWSEESSRNSQSGRQYEDRMSRVYDNTRVSHGQSSKWRRGWCRAERHGFTTPQTPSSPSPRRVHVEEHTLDRVFRRHPLPGALQDLMSQRHSLYGRDFVGKWTDNHHRKQKPEYPVYSISTCIDLSLSTGLISSNWERLLRSIERCLDGIAARLRVSEQHLSVRGVEHRVRDVRISA